MSAREGDNSPDEDSEAGRQAQRAGWQQWLLVSPEPKTATLAALNPSASEGHQFAQVFNGLRGQFRGLLRGLETADFYEPGRWRAKAKPLVDEAAKQLLSATVALSPQFWPLKSLSVDEWKQFSGDWLDRWILEGNWVALADRVSYVHYWLCFALVMIGRSECTDSWDNPNGWSVEDTTEWLGDCLEEGHLFDVDWLEPEIMCVTSAHVCRHFADWCSAEGKRLSESALVLDEATFTVRWRGVSCSLGNTRQFRLMQELHRRRGRYVDFATLATAVGGDSYDTVHHIKSRLIRKLNDADLSSLSNAVRTETGHYGLFIE